MDRREFEKLQMRVQKIEQRLRTVVAAWMLTLVVFMILGLWAQQAISQPTTVRARRLEIADEAGQTRIALDAVGRRPSMWFFDTSGKRRLGLALVAPGVPVLWLLDPEERNRIELSVLNDGGGALVFSDEQHRNRLWLNVGPDGTPSLSLSESLGRPKILLKLLDNGTPKLWMFDASGKVKFSAP